jgi:putative endonuclease
MTLNEKTYYVYLLASRRNGTLYVGVTNNLSRRVWEHKEGNVEGFTKEYGVKLLVYYESYPAVRDAIQREKNMKKWPRRWKIDLIRSMNPEWRDLYEELA